MDVSVTGSMKHKDCCYGAPSSPNETKNGTVVVVGDSFPRRMRCSRLDIFEKDSDVRQSTLSGFANLSGLVCFIYPWLTVLCNWYDRGWFIDVELAIAMFDDTLLLMLMWAKQTLWAFVSFFGYRLYLDGVLCRWQLRLIQYLSELLLCGYSAAACVVRGWPVVPSFFILMAAAIIAMKMHSFVESNLVLLVNTPPHEGEATAAAIATDSRSGTPSGSVEGGCGGDHRKEKVVHRNAGESLRADQVVNQKKVTDTGRYPYPLHITLHNYTYFLLAPVLVYDPSYPRGNGFRPIYFLQKIVSLITAILVLYLIVTEYILPTTMIIALLSVPEYVIRLVFPYMFAELLAFYILFECVCNLFAELTNFGDREFYQDFWNSTDFEEYSRKWNRPVHEFLRRHVYSKTRTKYKLSKRDASLTTFVVSAIAHEAIMAVTFRFLRAYTFFFMIVLQIPLMHLGKHYRNTVCGNLLFWAAMISGVPIIGVMYGREWAVREHARLALTATTLMGLSNNTAPAVGVLNDFTNGTAPMFAT